MVDSHFVFDYIASLDYVKRVFDTHYLNFVHYACH